MVVHPKDGCAPGGVMFVLGPRVLLSLVARAQLTWCSVLVTVARSTAILLVVIICPFRLAAINHSLIGLMMGINLASACVSSHARSSKNLHSIQMSSTIIVMAMNADSIARRG